ncbi:MAG: Holliday junction resolvase RuvX [Candidatus Omnitrophica bacterium]|nr:Holliday junction resolvase RuvX [Candidatus Omnitrophota bacterium]
MVFFIPRWIPDPGKAIVNLQAPGRILALDLGQKRVGLALSDDLRITAQPYATLEPRGTEDLLESLRQIAARENVVLVLIGLPKRLDGSLGPQAEEAKTLAALIRERLSLPVRLWDERFSTHAAKRALLEDNVSRKKRKQVIDQTAAAWILQGFLDSL